MKKLTETRTKQTQAFLEGLYNRHIDIAYNVDIEQLYSDMEDGQTAYDSIFEQLSDNGCFDVEIIYYSVAMEYLTENDTSLNESLSIAEDMGFSLSSLNSETLASLLASQLERENFSDYESEIDEFFDNLFN